jgi:hypothetical protein
MTWQGSLHALSRSVCTGYLVLRLQRLLDADRCKHCFVLLLAQRIKTDENLVVVETHHVRLVRQHSFTVVACVAYAPTLSTHLQEQHTFTVVACVAYDRACVAYAPTQLASPSADVCLVPGHTFTVV